MLRKDLAEMPNLKLYADQICQAVHAMDRLLANLLTYTRPERTPRAWHEAEPLILDSLTLAAHAITKSPVDIRLDLDPWTPVIWCHDGQMRQVFLNLIVNAVQAMPSGGVLTIGVRRDTESVLGVPAVRITVADSGIGIDPAHRSRIFDPFFTTKDDGTGLGLAIVHAIVDAHRGRIDVDSTVGQGTSITIVLPHPGETRPAPVASQHGHCVIPVLDARDRTSEMVLTEDGSHE
jgi:signal transduction histidine kinase